MRMTLKDTIVEIITTYPLFELIVKAYKAGLSDRSNSVNGKGKANLQLGLPHVKCNAMSLSKCLVDLLNAASNAFALDSAFFSGLKFGIRNLYCKSFINSFLSLSLSLSLYPSLSFFLSFFFA